MEVRKERTGWRDSKLSERHRMWGYDCPALDLDLLMLEYDEGKPCALVEYKNEHAKRQYSSHPSYRALIRLGDLSHIPVFACRYTDDLTEFTVTALNDAALAILETRQIVTDEIGWVRLLYKTRGRDEVPKQVQETINEGLSF